MRFSFASLYRTMCSGLSGHVVHFSDSKSKEDIMFRLLEKLLTV